MTNIHRQNDVWVLDGYLDEAGWDGQHQQFYFTRKQDAEFVGKQLAEAFEDHNNGMGFEFEVYKLEPWESFYQRETERNNLVRSLIVRWRE